MRNILSALALVFVVLVPINAHAAAEFREYEPGIVKTALEEGKTVFLNFHATWCGTCRAQDRVINALVSEKPEYKDAMMFIRVDWDTYGNSEITQKYEVPRRSTIVLLKGEEVLGKLIADTSKASIETLMNKGL